MIRDGIEALCRGEFILLYDFDDRERETDFAISAAAVRPGHIFRMRRDGGGLICTAVGPEAAQRLGLPFAHEILSSCGVGERHGEIPYDPKNHSSFSLWVNHRRTFTGITDNDRAFTINAISEQVRKALNGGGADFCAEFRTPGHVALLRAAEGLLDRRRGQTELSIALAGMAGIPPAVTICEMLDGRSGNALSKEDAKRYGSRHGIPFLEGSDVLEAWERLKAP